MKFLLILALGIPLCFLPFCQASAQSAIPKARNGVIDLRRTDLSKRSIPLNGAWALYWGQLLTPQSKPAQEPIYPDFPALWGHVRVNGSSLPSQGCASYELTVLLPVSSDQLALDVPATYSSYRLFVNGAEVATAGSPGTTEATTVNHFLVKTVGLTGATDTLHLIFQVANFMHSKGGSNRTIFIGDKKTLLQQNKIEDAFDILLAGCLIMTGLFFLGLFLFGRHDKSILYFSLFALTYSYRIVGSRSYALHTLFPQLPWSLTLHFEYLSLLLSIVFFSIYTRQLYPKDASKYLIWTQVVICLGLTSIVLVCSPMVFTGLINFFLVVMFGMIICAFYVYIRAFRNHRVGSSFALASTAVLLVEFILIILQYFEVFELPRLILFAGYLSFFFLQSLILLFRFTHALKSAISELGESNTALEKSINELNATQSQLIQAEKMASLGELTAGIAHEIQNPLNFVNNFSELNKELLQEMQGELEQGNQAEAASIADSVISNEQKIAFHGRRADAIVKGMLQHSRSRTGQKVLTDINALADEYLRLSYLRQREINPSFSAVLDTDFDGSLEKINVVPQDISRVLLNVLNNAFYAVNEKKKEGPSGYDPKIFLSTRRSGNALHLHVRDNGNGIPRATLDKIFQPFFTTKPTGQGTGLGLSLAYDIIKAHGGDIHAETVVGQSTEFIIKLPLE